MEIGSDTNNYEAIRRLDADTNNAQPLNSQSRASWCGRNDHHNQDLESPEKPIKTPPLPVLKSAQKAAKNVTPEWPTLASETPAIKADISLTVRQQQENQELRTPTKPLLMSVEKSRRKLNSVFDGGGGGGDDRRPYRYVPNVQRTLQFD